MRLLGLSILGDICLLFFAVPSPAAATGVLSVFAKDASAVRAIACSPDGEFVAFGGEDGVIVVRSLDARRKPTRLDAKLGSVQCLSFHPGSNLLAACYRQPGEFRASTTFVEGQMDRWRPKYSLLVWNLEEPGQRVSVEQSVLELIECVAFSPDGQMLATTSGESIVLRDTFTFREKANLRRPPVPWVREGKGVWGRPLYTVSHLAFSPDGKLLASRAPEDVIRVWDVETAKEAFTLRGCGDRSGPVAFSPDGRLLAAGAWLRYNPDRSTGQIPIWDVASRKHVKTLAGHNGLVHCLAFSPDGKLLASGGGDQQVSLWEIASREELAVLRDSFGDVLCLTFGLGGRTLFFGSRDGTVRHWKR